MNRIEDMNGNNKGTGAGDVTTRGQGLTVFATVIALALPLAIMSCAQPAGGPTAAQAAAPTAVTLVAGDVIKLTFSGAPELSQSQKIRTDGKVNLPLIGEVTAAGKTVALLQTDLVQLYKSQLRSSTVVVTLESSVTQVTVSGAVAGPRKLSFERPTTVFQAIMEAGGINEFGTLRNVHVVRLINGQQQTEIIDLRPATSGLTTKPYYVRDGDVIIVQKSIF
jgi:polysaccharide biosynthesis/export protein